MQQAELQKDNSLEELMAKRTAKRTVTGTSEIIISSIGIGLPIPRGQDSALARFPLS